MVLYNWNSNYKLITDFNISIHRATINHRTSPIHETSPSHQTSPNHQTSHFLTGFIGEPLGQFQSWLNSSIFANGILTLAFPGECGSNKSRFFCQTWCHFHTPSLCCRDPEHLS